MSLGWRVIRIQLQTVETFLSSKFDLHLRLIWHLGHEIVTSVRNVNAALLWHRHVLFLTCLPLLIHSAYRLHHWFGVSGPTSAVCLFIFVHALSRYTLMAIICPVLWWHVLFRRDPCYSSSNVHHTTTNTAWQSFTGISFYASDTQVCIYAPWWW